VLEVVEDAGNEARLAEGFRALVSSFNSSDLAVVQHGARKDSFILVGTASLIAGLEAAQLSLSSIANNKYVSFYPNAVDAFRLVALATGSTRWKACVYSVFFHCDVSSASRDVATALNVSNVENFKSVDLVQARRAHPFRSEYRNGQV
jgi:hypothetical protein